MKRVMWVFLALLSAMLIVGCNSYEDDAQVEALIPIDKVRFLLFEMDFDSRIVFEGREISPNAAIVILNNIDPLRTTFNPFYTDFIIVHAEEETQNLPDNIISAWPGPWTQGLLKGLNWAANRDEADLVGRGATGAPIRGVLSLEDFGLTYPITVDDLIYNWEKVNAFWISLATSEQSFIRSAAPHGGPYAGE